MVVEKIICYGCNYTVVFVGGAIRHFSGTEAEFNAWLERKTNLVF